MPPARGLRRAGALVAVVAAGELAVITLQAARGVPSHFNNATSFDALIFQVMGAAISLLWAAEVYVAVRAFRHGFSSAARTWGIRLGLVGTLLGGAVGFIMPFPSATQRAQLAAGQTPPLVGAHAVGVPDGGPGLPVTRWSTVGGDLRVPHFLGLHALQLLPLAGVFVERRRRATRHVLALATATLGLTALTLVQALRAQPLLHPDALTLFAGAVLLAAATMIASWQARLGPAARAARGPNAFEVP